MADRTCTPVLIGQSLNSKQRNEIACGRCSAPLAKSLLTGENQLRLAAGWMTRPEAVALMTSSSERDPEAALALECFAGCGEVYCCEECRGGHFDGGHRFLCCGGVREGEAMTHPLILFKLLVLEQPTSTADAALMVSELAAAIAARVAINGGDVDGAEADEELGLAVMNMEGFGVVGGRCRWDDREQQREGSTTGILGATMDDPEGKSFREFCDNAARLLKDAFVRASDLEGPDLMNFVERRLENGAWFGRLLMAIERRSVRFAAPPCEGLVERIRRTLVMGVGEEMNVGGDDEPLGMGAEEALQLVMELLSSLEGDDDDEEEELEEEEEEEEEEDDGGVEEEKKGGQDEDGDDDEQEEDEEGEQLLQVLAEIEAGYLAEALPAVSGIALFPVLSNINHSCRPNCTANFELSGGMVHASLVATRSIEAGEELVMNYGDPTLLDAPWLDRQRYLRDEFSFVCECARCLEDEGHWDIGDDERAVTWEDVVTLEGAFTESECQTLIDHLEKRLEAEGRAIDSVDGAPEYQVDLAKPSLTTLRGLVSRESLERLWSQLRQLRLGKSDPRVAEGTPLPWDTADCGMFIRKYSPDTRSKIRFHTDVSAYTLNVALNGDGEYEGGALVGIVDGEQVPLRREGVGTATLHGPNVVHRVERMVSGVRYALIVFVFDTIATNAAEAEEEPQQPQEMEMEEPQPQEMSSLHQKAWRAPSVGMAVRPLKRAEDRAVAVADMFAIFDGHHGSSMADFSAEHFHEILRDNSATSWDDRSLTTVASIDSAREVLSSAFNRCHEKAQKAGIRGGTTALVFWICTIDSRLVGFCGNAGDSRAVLCRGGEALRLSVDHTADVPSEVARVEAVGGTVEFGMLADSDGDGCLKVTRGFGNTDLVTRGFTPEPYVAEEPVDLSDPANEFLILASDGLWDVMTDQEAVEIAKGLLAGPSSLAGEDNAASPSSLAGRGAEICARRLADEAASRGSGDDTSVIVVAFS